MPGLPFHVQSEGVSTILLSRKQDLRQGYLHFLAPSTLPLTDPSSDKDTSPSTDKSPRSTAPQGQDLSTEDKCVSVLTVEGTGGIPCTPVLDSLHLQVGIGHDAKTTSSASLPDASSTLTSVKTPENARDEDILKEEDVQFQCTPVNANNDTCDTVEITSLDRHIHNSLPMNHNNHLSSSFSSNGPTSDGSENTSKEQLGLGGEDACASTPLLNHPPCTPLSHPMEHNTTLDLSANLEQSQFDPRIPVELDDGAANNTDVPPKDFHILIHNSPSKTLLLRSDDYLTDSKSDITEVAPTEDTVPSRHYRILLTEQTRPITTFDSSRQYVSAIADAMEAHQKAYDRYGFLHRDINVKNVAIGADGNGILTDYDFVGDHTHSGSWHFASAAILQKEYDYDDFELIDDQESAFHILTWLSIFYTPHTRLSNIKQEFEFYDQCHMYSSATKTTGGKWKARKFRDQDHSHQQCEFSGREGLEQLIDELREVLGTRYCIDDGDYSKEEYEELLKNDPEQAMNHWYGRHLKQQEKGWCVDILRKYLTSEHAWPNDDAACINQFTKDAHKYYD